MGNNYDKPKMEVYEIQLEGMLCGSNTNGSGKRPNGWDKGHGNPHKGLFDQP